MLAPVDSDFGSSTNWTLHLTLVHLFDTARFVLNSSFTLEVLLLPNDCNMFVSILSGDGTF